MQVSIPKSLRSKIWIKSVNRPAKFVDEVNGHYIVQLDYFESTADDALTPVQMLEYIETNLGGELLI